MRQVLLRALATLCTSSPIAMTTPRCAPLCCFLHLTTARGHRHCRISAFAARSLTRWGRSALLAPAAPTLHRTTSGDFRPVQHRAVSGACLAIDVTAVACTSGCRVSSTCWERAGAPRVHSAMQPLCHAGSACCLLMRVCKSHAADARHQYFKALGQPTKLPHAASLQRCCARGRSADFQTCASFPRPGPVSLPASMLTRFSMTQGAARADP